jgi:hypothetical protein
MINQGRIKKTKFTRVSIKAKLGKLCLSVVVATGQKCAVATATATATSLLSSLFDLFLS